MPKVSLQPNLQLGLTREELFRQGDGGGGGLFWVMHVQRIWRQAKNSVLPYIDSHALELEMNFNFWPFKRTVTQ